MSGRAAKDILFWPIGQIKDKTQKIKDKNYIAFDCMNIEFNGNIITRHLFDRNLWLNVLLFLRWSNFYDLIWDKWRLNT